MLEIYSVLDTQVRRNNKERVCKEEGCNTILNPYNLSSYCYKCKRLRMIRGKGLGRHERFMSMVKAGHNVK